MAVVDTTNYFAPPYEKAVLLVAAAAKKRNCASEEVTSLPTAAAQLSSQLSLAPMETSTPTKKAVIALHSFPHPFAALPWIP